MNVLVLSASASAINVAMSLRERPDVRLFLTDVNPYASGLYLPGVNARLIPRATDNDGYRERLDEIIRVDAIDILLPTSDADIRAVARLRARGWAPPVKMFTPDPDVLEVMTDKCELPTRVRALGFTAPRIYASLEDAAAPAVVKPTRGSGAKGVVVAHDDATLRTAWSEMETHHPGGFVAQEYVPGGRGRVYVVMLLFDNAGRRRAAVASRSTLTFMTWGGGGNAGEIVEEPALVDEATAVVDALGGWRGPLNLEFIRDRETDQFSLMEINCRLNGYSFLYTMNGIDFPTMIIDLLRDEPLTPHSTPARRRNFVLGFREEPVAGWVT